VRDKPNRIGDAIDRIGLRYLQPVEIHFEEGIAAEWCECGFAAQDRGTGASERVRRAFKEHECPLKPNGNGASA
jgi:hypothetical protein